MARGRSSCRPTSRSCRCRRTPELNPVERVWLFLRERFLSHRLLKGYEAIVAACCEAWNALTLERLRSLCAYPWVAKVVS